MAQRGSETAPAATQIITMGVQPSIMAPMVGPMIIHAITIDIHPPMPAQKVNPGPTVAAATVHMATDEGNIIYTLVSAILVGGAVQSVVATWLWERLCPRRSTPTDAATIHMAVPTPTDAIHMAAPTPTATPTPTAPTRMLLTRTVSTQSQTTYKWWWQQPRFMPLPEHSHGVGLVDPFWNPRRR